MLKKISLVLSVLAAIGFAVSIASPANADPNDKDKKVHVNKNVHVNKTVNKNIKVNKNVQVHTNVQVNKNFKSGSKGKFVVGKTYNGHIWYGHSRHRWHGRWYDYGEGPCWINIDGEWFWNLLVCPI